VIFCSSRNLCPEHVEAVYRGHPRIENIAVFGDRRERLVAAVIPSDPCTDHAELARALAETAAGQLAEHERVQRFAVLDRAIAAPYFTVTGRPNRAQLWSLVETLLQEQQP
jgi:long-chain acyl-CoA synthetase